MNPNRPSSIRTAATRRTLLLVMTLLAFLFLVAAPFAFAAPAPARYAETPYSHTIAFQVTPLASPASGSDPNILPASDDQASFVTGTQQDAATPNDNNSWLGWVLAGIVLVIALAALLIARRDTTPHVESTTSTTDRNP